jgi:hypothetical protein
MEWKEWSNLPLTQRSQLPNHPGIYVITDLAEQVWYVGKSANLNNRWRGKAHHRYPQLSRSNKKNSFQIYWKPYPLEPLNELEQYYINLFNPYLNGTKVKSYIRKKTQPTAELKRIFQTLNRPTQIFPSVRSVVLGYYKELDEEEMKEYTNLVVLVNINDHDKIILGSAMRSQKRKGNNHLKDCWKEYACDCALDESLYSPITLLVFMTDDYVYEFVCCDELRESLKETPSKLYQVDLFNQSVTALKSPDTITEFPTNTYHLPSPDGRLRLHPNDYINYRVPMLQPVDKFLETFL